MKTENEINVAVSAVCKAMKQDITREQKIILSGILACLSWLEKDDPDNPFQQIIDGKTIVKHDTSKVLATEQQLDEFISKVKGIL